jgi:hypothetical protein
MIGTRRGAIAKSAVSAVLLALIAAPGAVAGPGSKNCGGDATTTKGRIIVKNTSCKTGRAVIKVYRRNLGQSEQMISGFRCAPLPSGNIYRVKCAKGAKRINWSALVD